MLKKLVTNVMTIDLTIFEVEKTDEDEFNKFGH
jgi:hypothetical protein